MSSSTRYDIDALGKVAVNAEALWSAQTQRSIENFPFDERERQPLEIIQALASIKEAAAIVNKKHGHLDPKIADSIITAARSIRMGAENDSFPLVIWQTGSGTQTNMNINEVIANKASVALGGQLGKKAPVHPNDHVNKGQSSNDVFPSAISIAVAILLEKILEPTIAELIAGLETKVKEFRDIVKIGRTHMMDAVPMTLGQEFSAYLEAVKMSKDHLHSCQHLLHTLALGGTAVGTGLNSYRGFDVSVAEEVSRLTNVDFITAPNKFLALSMVTPLVAVSGALTVLATTLLKMVNDIRLLASGPRAGLAELQLPANEPGSSIMPGKVNPTQCESLAMVCVQAIGNNQTVISSASYGHLQLNLFLPVVASNLIRTIRLLSQSMINFNTRCLLGITPNRPKIAQHLSQSLMLVTALVPYVGYDAAAQAALHAHQNDLTLKQSATQLGIMSPEEFDEKVKPQNMVQPNH